MTLGSIGGEAAETPDDGHKEFKAGVGLERPRSFIADEKQLARIILKLVPTKIKSFSEIRKFCRL